MIIAIQGRRPPPVLSCEWLVVFRLSWLLKSIKKIIEFVRSLVCLMFVCSSVRSHLFTCSLVRSFIRLLVRSFARFSFVRSHLFICSLVRSFVCSFVRSLTRSLVSLFARSPVCSFVPSRGRWFVRSFICLFIFITFLFHLLWLIYPHVFHPSIPYVLF